MNVLTNSYFYLIGFYIFWIYSVYTKYRDKMAVINIRINDEVKKEAETIFKALGLNMSVAMNLFLKNV